MTKSLRWHSARVTMPKPVSPPSLAYPLAELDTPINDEKKQRVLTSLGEFFDRFFGLGAGSGVE